MKTQTESRRRHRRKDLRCLTMRQARMILIANALAGWLNPDGSTCQRWHDESESMMAAKMMREQAIATSERHLT